MRIGLDMAKKILELIFKNKIEVKNLKTAFNSVFAIINDNLVATCKKNCW